MAADCQKMVDSSRYTKFRVTFPLPFIPPAGVHKVVLNGQTQQVCGITCGQAWTISRADESIVLNLSPTEQELASRDEERVAVVKPYYKNKKTMECRGRHITFDEQMVVVEIQRADERIVSFLGDAMTTSPSTPDLSTKKRKGKPARQARKPKGHRRHVKDRDGDATEDVSSPLTVDAEDVEDAAGVLNESQVDQLELEELPVLPEFGQSIQEEWKILFGSPANKFNGVVGSGDGMVDGLVKLIQQRIAIGKHEHLRA